MGETHSLEGAGTAECLNHLCSCPPPPRISELSLLRMCGQGEESNAGKGQASLDCNC